MADPDWWARGIAAVSAGMATLALASNRYDSRWKRRHVAMERVRPALDDLEPTIRNWQDPLQVSNLFTVVAASHINDLVQEVDRIPDVRFRRHLRSFTSDLSAARGGQLPANPDGVRAALTETQIEKIRAAKRHQKWMTKRMNAAAKKGGA